ncbi:MAG TPA: ABC transporter ATP-binding protein, partial [Candidatus Methylomirabilis sp.]|nr:ABC transporter ATP-binding protein [Candidatus Methylomirabilis sp.]
FREERGEATVEFFDRDRFASYASIGENILFGQGANLERELDQLAGHDHFRRVIADVGLQGPLLALGADAAKEMVEIFKDIPADDELFANFSLISAAELPEYTQLVSRLERVAPAALPQADQERLITLSLRVIPARHRLGQIDADFMAKVVAARHRFVDTLPPALQGFLPYDRERYFAERTLLENLLFGRAVSTSSLAVKRVNAIVEEVITTRGLREVVLEAGLDYHVGVAGSRLSPAQRHKVALARGLLKRPNILIMDDPFGALEPDKRAAMHQRVTEFMKGRTIVAVVKEPDLARFYDHVVVLDSGKVVEVGSYEELVGRESAFRRLKTGAGAATSGGT